MCCLSKATDIVLVSRTHGRTHAELFGLVGPFFDATVLRVSVSMSDTFAELIAQVQSSLDSSYPHQVYPYQLIKSSLPDIAPWLNFRDANATGPERESSRVKSFDLPPRPAVKRAARTCTGFSVLITVDAAGLQVVTEYLDVLYEKSTVARFTQGLCRVLEEGARDPARSLHALLGSGGG
jgi:hypothetical protein